MYGTCFQSLGAYKGIWILEIEDHRGVSNFKGGALFCHQVVALGGGIGSVKYDFCSQRCSSH